MTTEVPIKITDQENMTLGIIENGRWRNELNLTSYLRMYIFLLVQKQVKFNVLRNLSKTVLNLVVPLLSKILSETQFVKKKKTAISTRIRRMAKENEYHARKSKGLWYIENIACPPRGTPIKGLTDEQAIEWIKENSYFNYPV